MIYKQFKEVSLSSLGMGCMRLPTKNSYGEIDKEKTIEMFDYCVSNGINYFDTAYGYHEGNSEIVVGEILKRYPREKIYLASKFPGFKDEYFNNYEQIFEEQLRKCQVEYFDFYLLHNVAEENIDRYLDPNQPYFQYLLKQKENGRIRHLGFSTHGSLSTMKRFLDTYGQYMEFCQIQLNYLDYKLQNAKAKIELLNQYNLKIWVMEPLRGGKLAVLDDEYINKLQTINKEYKVVEWAFRFLQTIPNVVMTLSGMSNFEQVRQNIITFNEDKPLDENEFKGLLEVADLMMSKKTLPCTGCRYCTSYCPKLLEIPEIIELYNDHLYSDGSWTVKNIIRSFDEDKKPHNCIGCKACESVCPQNIKISEMMKDLAEAIK